MEKAYKMKAIKRWLDLSYIKRNFLIAICVGTLICLFAIAIQKIGLENNYTKEALTAIFSVVTSLLALYATHESSSRQHALQYITNKRFDWLRDIRTLTSKLCGKMSLAEIYFDEWNGEINEEEKNKKKLMFMEKYSKICEVMAKLYLYYNFGGERDHILLLLLRKLDTELKIMTEQVNSTSSRQSEKKDREKILKLLEDHTQVYLKLEWERIKDETKYAGNIKQRSHFIRKKMIKQRQKLYDKKFAFESECENISLDNLEIGKIKDYWRNNKSK